MITHKKTQKLKQCILKNFDNIDFPCRHILIESNNSTNYDGNFILNKSLIIDNLFFSIHWSTSDGMPLYTNFKIKYDVQNITFDLGFDQSEEVILSKKLKNTSKLEFI